MVSITLNAIQCKHCGIICISRYRHEYQPCECGAVAADGGLDYLRRAYKTSPEIDYIELSESGDE